MTEQERQKLQVKVASCPTCKGWITQAAFPWCEEDADSQQGFAAHIKDGDTVEVMTVGEGMLLSYCECYKLRKAEAAASKATKKMGKAAAKTAKLFNSFSL
ncbi:hypothetical protein [Hymenobacter ruber]